MHHRTASRAGSPARTGLPAGAVGPAGTDSQGNGNRRREEDTVDQVMTWSVSIDIGEHDGRTRAVAHLHTRDDRQLAGVGFARLAPTDRDIPEIGAELATARALADLSRRLLGAATEDVEAVTGQPGHLVM
jgi:hypothetical protein